MTLLVKLTAAAGILNRDCSRRPRHAPRPRRCGSSSANTCQLKAAVRTLHRRVRQSAAAPITLRAAGCFVFARPALPSRSAAIRAMIRCRSAVCTDVGGASIFCCTPFSLQQVYQQTWKESASNMTVCTDVPMCRHPSRVKENISHHHHHHHHHHGGVMNGPCDSNSAHVLLADHTPTSSLRPITRLTTTYNLP